MTWKSNYAVFIFCFLWLLLNILNLKRKSLSETLEIVILIAAFVFFYYYSENNLFEKCIALGNGLAVLQIIRLTCSLGYRKKMLAFAMASTQIAIGTQIVLDYAFLIVLILLIILIPKFLYSIQSSVYTDETEERTKFRFLKHKTEYIFVLVISILFFLFFPRINFESNNAFYNDLGLTNNSVLLTKPELKTSLASVSEKDIDKEELIFQVYADNLKYFKMLSMDKFNGDLWSVGSYGYLHKRNFRRRVNLAGYHYRKIDIKYENFESRFLPADGDVHYIEGNFFDNPTLTRTGNITIPENINRNNKTYEYWCNPDPKSAYLSAKYRKILTRIKGYSSKLENWLNELVENDKTKYEMAVTVRNYLKTNLKYELGAPELDKKYPVENFIFYDKKGHCERFASALAVLLRIIDVPAIITVGYRAREKNEVGNYYNIRGGDAHAWVEAYFEGKGWIILDATPAADFGANRSYKSTGLKWTFDYIEYIWYSKIVNLSYGEQLYLFNSIGDGIKIISIFLSKFFVYLLFMLGFLVIMLIILKYSKTKLLNLKFYFNFKKKREIKLEHFYGKMLKILSKNKIYKHESLTPIEFLKELESDEFIYFNEIKYITNVFCKMKYGERLISGKELRKVERFIELLNKEK
jgi:hypothetical protein